MIVVGNLQPRPLVGFTSHGMVLCGWDKEHTRAEFVEPPEGAVPGELVTFEGHGVPCPDDVLKGKKKKVLGHWLGW